MLGKTHDIVTSISQAIAIYMLAANNPPNAICIPHIHFTCKAYRGEVCPYICLIWTYCDQPCGQKYYTMPSNCISCLWQFGFFFFKRKTRKPSSHMSIHPGGYWPTSEIPIHLHLLEVTDLLKRHLSTPHPLREPPHPLKWVTDQPSETPTHPHTIYG